ncbi:MAG: hypothetical protein VXV91_00060 [Verrucomicrobiota bacterium]|nr:hypothetical protein [Verrucomicrobiota bacterium]MEC7235055.1 hypothetical protein [Verrucomicrobiota bacterium]MEC7287057.1 hypothetical protein [Verrucomicrobiota bacterium]MEC8208970.1 hypothetical protein [Verrucomicrobiota bacterium]
MTIHKIFLSALIIACFPLSNLVAEDCGNLIQDEDFIPFHAIIETEIETELGALKKGEMVVVIRPIDAETIRVNVPRKGLLTLPLNATSIGSEIERAKNTEDPNYRIVPRMSFFLANRVMSGESLWQDLVHGGMVYRCKRWILLYGNAEMEVTRSVVAAASEFYKNLNDSEREETIFVYMDVPGNKKAIQELAEDLSPSIQCMPGYLSRSYSKSLDHINPNLKLPQLVEVTSSGRMICQLHGQEEILDWLLK